MHGRTVLLAAFYHGEHGVIEDEIGYFDYQLFRWVLHDRASSVDNYYVAIESINGLGGDFLKLCYNCHGIKHVRVSWSNSKMGRQGWREIDCPTCKGRGVLPRDSQVNLL